MSLEVMTENMSGISQSAPYLHAGITVASVQDPALLRAAFERFEADGLADTIWHDGPVTADEWVEWATDEHSIVLGAFQTPGENVLQQDIGLFGMAWVNKLRVYGGFAKAEIGFGCFRAAPLWKKLVGARLMVKAFFDTFPVDFVFAATPDQNPAAIRFAERVGFEKLAYLPGYCAWRGNPATAVVLSLSRRRWEAIRER